MPINDNSKPKTKMLAATTALALALSPVALGLSGCFGGGSSSDADNYIEIQQTGYQLELDAVNSMCNNALKFSITDIQRRPMSIFSGASIDNAGIDSTGESTVSATNMTNIVIQLDVSYTWNVTTYQQALAQAGGDSTASPSTLKDVLLPGVGMYISGEDADGNPYTSADIIVPDGQEDINALAINSQWDYDVMNSPLPETSVTKTGSILFRVPSTVSDVKLNIITPMGGQPVDEDMGSSTTSIYELPLA